MKKTIKKSKKGAVVAVMGALLFPSFMISKAYAIPAFSRMYQKECATCHTMYPERNEYGEAFEKNGYYPPEGVSKAATRTAGSPNVIDPLVAVGIPSQVPVSFWGQADITNNKNNPAQNNRPQLNLDGGTSLDLMAGGNFLGKVGYWADYDLAGNQVGEVFLQLMKPIPGIPVNIKIGKFEPKTSLWKSNNNAMIADFGHLATNVDRNPTTGEPNFTLDTQQNGVELNGVLLPRLFFATGITNGLHKKTNGKDWYGHISTKIGGADFKGVEPEMDLDKTSFVDFLSLTIGGYGYIGSSNDSNNHFYRTGIDAELNWKQAKLKIGGVYGHDNNPSVVDSAGVADPLADQLAANSKMGMVQGEYLLNPSLLTSLRYEIEDVEHQNVARRIIPSVVYSPVQNVKLILEYVSENTSEAAGTKIRNDQANFRVSFAL